MKLILVSYFKTAPQNSAESKLRVKNKNSVLKSTLNTWKMEKMINKYSKNKTAGMRPRTQHMCLSQQIYLAPDADSDADVVFKVCVHVHLNTVH